MDIMSLPVSIPSMEGYNHALIIVDGSMYLWVYGLKERSDANLVILLLENGCVT